MAKIKLMRFELIALLSEKNRIIDYVTHFGNAQIEKCLDEQLGAYKTDKAISAIQSSKQLAQRAVAALEKYCEIKKGMIASLTDYTFIDYDEYKQICDTAEQSDAYARKICSLCDEIDRLNAQTAMLKSQIDYYTPWQSLDIPMCSSRTASSSIFIGTIQGQLSKEEILTKLFEKSPDTQGVELQIISSDPMQTCIVAMCHRSDAAAAENALRSIGFQKPDNPAKKLPKAAIEEFTEGIGQISEQITQKKFEIKDFSDKYSQLRFYCDCCDVQIDKLEAISKGGTTQKAIFFEGYVPERKSEEFKFEIEKRFTASLELLEPDYENDDVPVLIENNSFAAGVESISNMYSPPSNDDVDPNPVMSVFYYALFGLMLSDAGYGLLMVLVALFAKFKLKVMGNMKKTADFALWCGVSTVIWGVLFGGFFGDLIPTVCTTFLHMETAPDMALWFDPKEDSMKMLLFSFLFGIIHLFVGLAIRFYNLCRHHDYVSAICDVIPVYVFVTGFAIAGKNFISPVSQTVKTVGYILLVVGAALIVLTSGRSAKNIFGKLGGGLYGLYNTTTGYMSDILSYSRLLALNLVTGVIAMVVNLLGAMFGNVFMFILIFLVGHTINIAINLIGTYVHTSRLQYVEFFSKFYEGGGRSFTPLKINSKYFKLKEETNND